MSVLKVVLLFVMFGVLGGCDQESESQVSTEDNGIYHGTIMAVGDSLTAGLGVNEEASYPAQLQQKLEVAGKKYYVINAGVSGETTSGTLSRLDWILSAKPDIVILETGANDGLRGIDPAIPRKNIDEILTRFENEGVVVVFAGMKMVWNLGPAYIAAFNSIYPETAADHKVIFMPFFLDGVATIPRLNTGDGLHPNESGYAVVVEKIYPYVLQAIKKFEETR